MQSKHANEEEYITINIKENYRIILSTYVL
jgi:hypothetical protein